MKTAIQNACAKTVSFLWSTSIEKTLAEGEAKELNTAFACFVTKMGHICYRLSNSIQGCMPKEDEQTLFIVKISKNDNELTAIDIISGKEGSLEDVIYSGLIGTEGEN